MDVIYGTFDQREKCVQNIGGETIIKLILKK
jgi:hypothetical protein